MNPARLLDITLDLLYPRNCLLCHQRIVNSCSTAACNNCLAQLVWNEKCCGRCGLPGDCSPCAGQNFAFDSVWSIGPYLGDFRQLIHAFKFGRRKALGRDLARFMLRADEGGLRLGPGIPVIPVPLHPLREKERGFNQAAVLAEELAKAASCVYWPDVLIKPNLTVPQAQLDRAHRWESVSETFALRRNQVLGKVYGGDVILVDDVLTTGATAQQCAKLLRQAGARSVSVVVAARSVEHAVQKNILHDILYYG